MQNFPRTTLQRHQSFHGFQNPPNIFHLSGNPAFMGSQNSTGYNAFIPSIFSHLPQSFHQQTGSRTISGIPVNNNQAYLPPSFYPQNVNPFWFTNPFSIVPQRVVGRNEAQFEIRRSASGINKPESTPEEKRSKRLATIVEKRFASLDIKKKHKCYSPTFYSMRCKKHAKKRPIIVTLPKKCFSALALSKDESLNDSCDKKSSSEVFEDSQINDESGLPVPAPRCRRYKRTEIVYANISQQLNKSNESNDTSVDSNTEANNEISVTEVQIHATKDDDTKSEETISDSKEDNKTEKQDTKPVLVAVSPKTNPLLSPQALKNSPVLKVSPNFIKPKTESPKGALSLQIQAKLKASPLQSPTDPNKKFVSDNGNDEKAAEQFPNVPQMPVLSTANASNANTSTNDQNAFYTLNPPHFKQLTPAEQPPQYSATIPHQHHHQKHSSQLLPKALFQEPLSKSKSFNNKSKQKKHHFQIPLQKCNSFKFQTAESYFQPIKNLHEENLMRNGYASDYQEDTHRRQKREKHKKAKGPLVLRRPGPGGHQESVHFQVNMQNSIQLQYPQPVLGPHQRANGVVYADLDMPSSGSGSKQGSYDSNSLKNGKKKSKTEYATLKFDDVGQEIDV
ncbi:unnamed protein product [Acanthoscelides obtectus]|uniref:Uncharacterized protein n=1 Tax=Acanthoscelides obtectus TaxID=200917 RepID=A0A9P0KZ70_ACAOB|nr:unnamed protein product [Acanthoscelides obtectus]CAK1675866.1 hypothetical protein AOBTE_LOCUS30449 [Acanthoscelides obtectus]